MRIGVPRETAPGERRVALVPEVVAKLVEGGHTVVVERGAGSAASFADAQYEEAGATLVDSAWDADAVVKVQKPTGEEAGAAAQRRRPDRVPPAPHRHRRGSTGLPRRG